MLHALCKASYSHRGNLGSVGLNKSTGNFALAARMHEPHSGRLLEVFTNQPGIQYYSGNSRSCDHREIGRRLQRSIRVLLETQHFPGSPNKANFPTPIFQPSGEYRTRTIYGLRSGMRVIREDLAETLDRKLGDFYKTICAQNHRTESAQMVAADGEYDISEIMGGLYGPGIIALKGAFKRAWVASLRGHRTTFQRGARTRWACATRA
jgi:hypothetical protein